MMETFRTTKPFAFSDLLKDLAITIGMFCLLYIVVFLWFPQRLTSYSLVLPVILLIMQLYDLGSTSRLQQLSFDFDKSEVVIDYKSLFSPPQQYRLPFSAAKVEVEEKKNKHVAPEPLAVYFLKGKREVFALNKRKDGLPIDALQQIVRTAEQLSIPIIRK